MNRIFKTKWSVAHQEYVVMDEKHANRGKPSKSVVAVATMLASLALGSAANAAYVEPGFVATSHQNFEQAKQSFETAEYKKDWGLDAMHASTAYALGYHGQGTKVAVMDSGALLQKHAELSGNRFSSTHVSGAYGSSGNRYPQAVSPTDKGRPYEKGEHYEVDGQWMEGVNDSHGTHVTGTVGANRDGSEFHGVAWGSDVVVGNTGATDDNNYGPFQDYDYFKAGWSALADALVAANGEKRGGVINNSWGTNTRVKGKTSVGADNYNTSVHLDVNTMGESEYEYFLFKKNYGDNPNFVDAAYDAVKGKNVVQVMTTGNRDMKNPYYRAAYPYFNPEAEKHWVAVAGLKQATDKDKNIVDGKFELVKNFNEAGFAKYWTVAAPGNAIYSSTTSDNGEPGFAAWGGTSMAAPHVTGAMGVLMSRYTQMTALQVRDVMLTTANHKNADGTNMEGWNNVNGTTPTDGQVSDRMGWGVPDLGKGMYGIGQFLGQFDYDMDAGSLDVWSNDITQVALDQRKVEDENWMKLAKLWLNDHDHKFTEEELKILGDMQLDLKQGQVAGFEDQKVSKEDAIAWRTEYFNKRIAAIEKRLYDGSLVKSGEGTLVMTGNNSYRGGTTVKGGTLVGFNTAFGVTGDSSAATANGKVTVEGGTFGIINSYDDQFTKKGLIDQKNQAVTMAGAHSVDVDVKAGATLMIQAGANNSMGNLTLADGAKVVVGTVDGQGLAELYTKGEGASSEGTLTVDAGSKIGQFTSAESDLAFFDSKVTTAGNKLTGTLTRNSTTMDSLATTANSKKIAAALDANANSAISKAVIGSTKAQATSTMDTLGSDAFLNVRNASIVNGMSLSRAVLDQANGQGQARQVQSEDGKARLWASGIGAKSSIDYGMSDMDSDFYAGVIGAETQLTDSTKLGAMFGAGQTDNKAGSAGQVKSNDVHLAIYGATNLNDQFTTNYGAMYTYQHADASRYLDLGSIKGVNTDKANAHMTQVFGELAYNGLSSDNFELQPYAGLSWIHIKSDSIDEKFGAVAINTETKDQDLAVTSIGARAAVPFSIGSVGMKAKADVAWNHFFGDTSAEALLNMDGAIAGIEGGEMKDMANVGLGVEAQMGQNTTFGFSYTGMYNGDVTSHGVFANVRVKF